VRFDAYQSEKVKAQIELLHGRDEAQRIKNMAGEYVRQARIRGLSLEEAKKRALALLLAATAVQEACAYAEKSGRVDDVPATGAESSTTEVLDLLAFPVTLDESIASGQKLVRGQR
jgi:hypothetical protein